MNGRIGGVGGILAAAGIVVVVCCGVSLLLGAAVGLGVGAWLAAHGLWLLGGVTPLAAAATLIAVLLQRRAIARAVREEDADADVTLQPENRDSGRS